MRNLVEAFENFFSQSQEDRERPTPMDITPETLKTPEEHILELREKESKKLLEGNSMLVELIKLKDDGSGVFKPKHGEKYVFEEVEEGTYYKRERATYLVDRFLGFGLVPPTSIREIDGEVGSLQQFIPNAITPAEASIKRVRKLPKDQFITLWLFDYLTRNADRHNGNVFIVKERIYAIDHGLSFSSVPVRFEPYYDYDKENRYPNFYDEKVSEETVRKIKLLAESEQNRHFLRELLLKLLPENEVNAFFVRLDRIAKMLEKGYIAESEKQELERFD